MMLAPMMAGARKRSASASPIDPATIIGQRKATPVYRIAKRRAAHALSLSLVDCMSVVRFDVMSPRGWAS